MTKKKNVAEVIRLCKCGCGQVVEGRADKEYATSYCRFKGYQQRHDLEKAG